MTADPFAALLAAYDDPDAVARTALADGRRVIRTIGTDAPRELLRAAGYQPVRLAPAAGATPRADAVMGQKGLGRAVVLSWRRCSIRHRATRRCCLPVPMPS
jgi:hypothetical protein